MHSVKDNVMFSVKFKTIHIDATIRIMSRSFIYKIANNSCCPFAIGFPLASDVQPKWLTISRAQRTSGDHYPGIGERIGYAAPEQNDHRALWQTAPESTKSDQAPVIEKNKPRKRFPPRRSWCARWGWNNNCMTWLYRSTALPKRICMREDSSLWDQSSIR